MLSKLLSILLSNMVWLSQNRKFWSSQEVYDLDRDNDNKMMKIIICKNIKCDDLRKL